MLHIDTDGKLHLQTSDFVGRCTAVLGMTNSGKTNTAAVLIEELLSQGFPMTIVDIEGEYYGLKERYELLVAGRSEHAELEIGVENAAQLAEMSVERGISVILDLSEYTEEDQYSFLVAYFTRMWEVAGKKRQPYHIILEEAHEWIPQSVRTPLKQLLTRIALRGRKRGLGIILMSQRSAKVEKDVLTQAAMLFLQKVVHPIDIKVYRELVPLAGVVIEGIINELQQGQAVVVENNMAHTVSIRRRYTFHAGATPEFGASAQPELRKIDEGLLKELQSALKKEKNGANTTEAKLTKRITELETTLAERDAEIARLCNENALLSTLSVSMQGAIPSTVPDELSIRHATVQQMHVGGSTMGTSATVVEAAPSTALPADVSPAAISKPVVHVLEPLRPPLNEKKFALFQKRLSSCSPLHFAVLQLLTQQDTDLNIREIAAWLNRSEADVRNNPPKAFMTLKLIQRVKWMDGYHYESHVREYLEKEFPGVPVETLIERLFHG